MSNCISNRHLFQETSNVQTLKIAVKDLISFLRIPFLKLITRRLSMEYYCDTSACRTVVTVDS